MVIAQKNMSYMLGRCFIYGILILFCLYYLAPMYVMLTTSVKDMEEIRAGNIISLPMNPTFWAWQEAWSTACIGVACDGLKPYFISSVKMTIPAVIISTFIGAINGYVISKWQFRGSNFLFVALLFACFIPLQITILPFSQILGKMGLSGSIAGLVMAHVIYGIGFTTLFFRNYFVSIPTELVRAAQIDGASFWQIFWKIFLPISIPVMTVTVIWQFTNIWNDFLFAISFALGGDNTPVTVGLNNLVNTSSSVKFYNIDMAATIIAALPTLLVYILAGKYFVRGLTAGSVKG